MASTYIVLVNWNGHLDTIECLEALMRLDTNDFAIVIVDNASKDGSIEALTGWADADPAPRDGPVWDTLPPDRRHAPKLRVVSLAETHDPAPDGTLVTVLAATRNLGFAAANNVGARFAARDPEARFFWVLNNDTVVRPDALSQLVLHAGLHPDQGIVGATLLYYHSPNMVQGLGGWMWPGRALGGHIGFGLAADALPTAGEVEKKLVYVMGASMFIRREAWAAIGGMREDYFLYFEEPDLAQRLPTGTRQGVCLGAIVYHKEGGSIGTDSIGRPSDTSLYYYSVNLLRYFWRHKRHFVPVAIARIGWDAIGHVRGGDRAAARVVARAFVDAATGRTRRGPYGSGEFAVSDRSNRAAARDDATDPKGTRR